MSVQDFFAAPDELAVQRAALAGARLELPCAVVHPASRSALARALGVTPEQLDAVLAGELAYLRSGDTGAVIGEIEAYERDADIDFEACTLADGVAAFAPALVLRHVPIEPGRVGVEDRRLAPPIDDIDVLYIDLYAYGRYLRRMHELAAPDILLRSAKARLQHTLDDLVALRSGQAPADRWEPYEGLMTGAPASALCEPPLGLFGDREPAQTAEPRDCFVVHAGFLVMFACASVVIGRDGEVLDVFETCGLRPVGSSDRHVLFVSGGGRASFTGYFSPTPVVRDIRGHNWVAGALPDGLPRYVAGTIGDVKWAIVADLQRALGYRTSPGWMGDQCGGTTTSVDGIHAYDSGHFVVAAASGRRVLDMRFFGLEVHAFVQRADGAWRFIASEDRDEEEEEDGAEDCDRWLPRVVDEHAATILALPHHAVALSADGTAVLCASADALRLIDIDSGEPILDLDLRPLAPALALPDAAAHSPALWGDLFATFGLAEHIARQTPETIRAAFAAGCLSADSHDDATLAAAVATAAAHPRISAIRLPVRG